MSVSWSDLPSLPPPRPASLATAASHLGSLLCQNTALGYVLAFINSYGLS